MNGNNKKSCFQCKYAERITYPKESIIRLECFGKQNLEHIADAYKICENWTKTTIVNRKYDTAL